MHPPGLGGDEEQSMASMADRAAKAATARPGEKGRQAETPAEIPAPGWKEIAFRTWKEASKDNVSLVAAGVAFYGFLAMVPLRRRFSIMCNRWRRRCRRTSPS